MTRLPIASGTEIELATLKLVGLFDDQLDAAGVAQQLCGRSCGFVEDLLGVLACARKGAGRLGEDLTGPTYLARLLLGSFRSRPRDLRLRKAELVLFGFLPIGDVPSHLGGANDLAAESRTGELVTETSIFVRLSERGPFRSGRYVHPSPSVSGCWALRLHGLEESARDRFADDLRRRIPENAMCALVPAGDDTIERFADDCVIRGVHDGGQAKAQSSAFLRSVTSRIVLDTISPSSVSSGLRLISTGNSVPSFRKPKSSRPDPIHRVFGFAK